MNLVHFMVGYLSIGLIAAIILLISSKINLIVKNVLVSIVGGLWIYSSINFLATNSLYITKEQSGIFILISTTGGILVSFLAGILIIYLLIENKKSLDNSDEKI
ncbi:MAG: hypothetical protein AAF298_28920 [Cyanobacteria bacterium P01_A01_bin.40]